MNGTIKMDADRATLLEAFWRLSPEEIQAVVRYMKLLTAEATQAACCAFADFVETRATGLSIAELAAFCGEIES